MGQRQGHMEEQIMTFLGHAREQLGQANSMARLCPKAVESRRSVQQELPSCCSQGVLSYLSLDDLDV